MLVDAIIFKFNRLQIHLLMKLLFVQPLSIKIPPLFVSFFCIVEVTQNGEFADTTAEQQQSLSYCKQSCLRTAEKVDADLHIFSKCLTFLHL